MLVECLLWTGACFDNIFFMFVVIDDIWVVDNIAGSSLLEVLVVDGLNVL